MQAVNLCQPFTGRLQQYLYRAELKTRLVKGKAQNAGFVLENDARSNFSDSRQHGGARGPTARGEMQTHHRGRLLPAVQTFDGLFSGDFHERKFITGNTLSFGYYIYIREAFYATLAKFPPPIFPSG